MSCRHIVLIGIFFSSTLFYIGILILTNEDLPTEINRGLYGDNKHQCPSPNFAKKRTF